MVLGFLVIAEEIEARPDHRTFQISLSSGAVHTEDLMNARDAMRFGTALASRMNVFRHGGYFVDVMLAPAKRGHVQIVGLFDTSVSYKTALLGVMGAGVFAEGFFGPYGFAYGVGMVRPETGGMRKSSFCTGQRCGEGFEAVFFC